jgi:hypothetical protein
MTMTEAIDEARARLIPIVDRLIAENPQVAAQFGKVFGADASGSQWLTYGLTEKAAELTEAVQSAAPADTAADTAADEDSLGLTDLFGEITAADFADEDFLDDDFEVEEGDAEIVAG